MNIMKLEERLLERKRNTGTIFDNGYNSGIDDCIYILEQFRHSVIKNDSSDDKVNHPPHYNREGAMECIDEMVTVFGIDATVDFCKCNAWKYRYRASEKGNAEEDIKKSDWYVKKAEELKDSTRRILHFNKNSATLVETRNKDDIAKYLGACNGTRQGND